MKKKNKTGQIVMICISTLFVVLMLVVPLASVIVNSLKKGFAFYLESITTKTVLSALKVTLLATATISRANRSWRP